MHRFLSVLDEVILPSLSLLLCNCGIAEEIWAMVKLLPYETRLDCNCNKWIVCVCIPFDITC